MPTYISRRKHVVVLHRSRHFHRRSSKSSFEGYGFDCDEAGNVDEVKYPNFRMCLEDPATYEDRGVVAWESSYTEAAVIVCECCEAHVSLHGFTSTCECGADYNMSGQLLADRSQWGEETGESVSDILAADTDRDWDFGCP